MALILLFTCALACGAPSNLLVGKWRLYAKTGGPKPSPYCLPAMEFAPTTYTSIDAKGKTSTIPVTYVTGDSTKFPATVYVLTDAGIYYHTTYNFSNKDEMILNTAAMCSYKRQ